MPNQSTDSVHIELGQATPTTPEERRRGLVLLFISLLCIGMGQNLFFALFPPIARDIGMNEIEMSAIFTLSGIAWVIMSPVWGERSTKWGRKPIILIGIFGFGLSTIGIGVLLFLHEAGWFSLLVTFIAMVITRSLFGLLGSGAPAAAQAYVADRTSRAERTRGVAAIGAAFGTGTVVGPGFAAVFVAWHILAPFFVLGSMALIAMLSILWFLPERTKPVQPQQQEQQATLKFTDKRIRLYVIMGVIVSFIQAAVMQVAAIFVMDDMGLASAEATQIVGLGMMSMAVATLFAQLVIIPFSNLSVRALMIWGSFFLCVGILLLLLPVNLAGFVIGFGLQGLGMGLLRPAIAAASSLNVEAHEQGGVAGIINSTAAVGVIFVPVLIMPLYLLSHIYPFLLALVFSAAILLMAWRADDIVDKEVDSQAVQEEALTRPGD